MTVGKTSAAGIGTAAGDDEKPLAETDTAKDDPPAKADDDSAATRPPIAEPDRPADGPAVLEDGTSPAPDTATLDDRLRAAIRDEFQTVIDARPADPRDFDFKVSTVKWFGILCAAALLLILFANAYFINELFRTGRAHEPAIAFRPLMLHASATERLYELAVENEALNMRNNRSVSALFMRAYTQFLSVTAGMILAMLGAIFVLARVDSRETRAEANWKEFRWLINTASPGVLVAGLGVALVAFVAWRSITMIDTRDNPIFGNAAIAAEGSQLQNHMASEEFRQRMQRDLEKVRSEQ